MVGGFSPAVHRPGHEPQHGCKPSQPENDCGPGCLLSSRTVCPGAFCLGAFPPHPKPRHRIMAPPFTVRGKSSESQDTKVTGEHSEKSEQKW